MKKVFFIFQIFFLKKSPKTLQQIFFQSAAQNKAFLGYKLRVRQKNVHQKYIRNTSEIHQKYTFNNGNNENNENNE